MDEQGDYDAADERRHSKRNKKMSGSGRPYQQMQPKGDRQGITTRLQDLLNADLLSMSENIRGFGAHEGVERDIEPVQNCACYVRPGLNTDSPKHLTMQ